jgi:protein MPE1
MKMEMVGKIFLQSCHLPAAKLTNVLEYDDDTAIIPRSTTIIARRLPPIKPGAGRASRYMTGKMPVTSKNNSRKEQGAVKALPKSTPAPSNSSQITASMTEEERMALMFRDQTNQWEIQQVELAKYAPPNILIRFHN